MKIFIALLMFVPLVVMGDVPSQSVTYSASDPSLLNSVTSFNRVVTNRTMGESAEAKSSAQDDEGRKWNGWKIAAVVFLVLGIMGAVGVQLGWKMPSGNMGLVSSMPCEYLTVFLFLMSGLILCLSCAPTTGIIIVSGVGGLIFLACMISDGIKIFDGRCKENTEEKRTQPDESIIHCLDAGPNGEIRRKLQMEQQTLTIEQVKSRLYLPKYWDPDVKVRDLKVGEMIRVNAIATLDGPGEYEWVTIRHLSVDDTEHGSGPGVLIDAPKWMILIDVLEGGIMLKPHPLKAEGVRHAKRIVWDLDVSPTDGNQYQKFHHADEEGMKVRMGVFEIDGRMYRIISVAFARKNDCWRFEYAFPAADGVTPESLDLRAEEVEAARRIFVPIETFP